MKFLIKLVIVTVMVSVVGFGYLKYQRGSFSWDTFKDSVRSADIASLSAQISQKLDSLVIHTGQSPVVLGIQITEDSLQTVGDSLRGLPPDQLKIIRDYICQPASPSGGPASSSAL